MNVLHVITSMAARTGGPAVSAAEAARAVVTAGGHATILCTDMGSAPQGRFVRRIDGPGDFVTVDTEVYVRYYPFSSPARFAYSPELRIAIRSSLEDFDIVHIHSLFLYPQYAAFKEAIAAKKPYVISPRGALDPLLRKHGRIRKLAADLIWQRKMFDHAACVVASSSQEADWCRDWGYRGNLQTIPNAVQLEPYLQVGVRHSSEGDQIPLTVVNHGRLARKKGLPTLLSAISLVRREVPNVRLVLIGPDDEGIGDQLRVLANELGITESVDFTGHLSPPEIARRLACASIWALPSRGENFGMAVVEAMAAGLPVITTPEVNIAPEAYENGALLMTDGTAEAFATGILNLHRNPELSSRFGKAAAAYASRYLAENLAVDYLNLYRAHIR